MRYKYCSIVFGIIVLVFMLAGGGKEQPNEGGYIPTSQSSATPGNLSPRAWINIASIHMVDAMTGWAMSQESLLRTVDGGASWTDVTPKGIGSLREGTWSVYDMQTVWAVFNVESSTGITIYRTTDGGRKWESAQINTIPDHGRVTSLAFLDSTHGWLLISYGAAMGSESIGVFQTSDGAATWKLTASVTTNQEIPKGVPLTGAKNGLRFVDQKNGWLTGFSHANGIWLYSTSDGGQTWMPQSIVAPPGYQTGGGSVSTEPPHFFGRKVGLLPVEFRGQTPPVLVFYRTQDGGMSWTPTTPVQSAQESLESYWGFHWSIIDATHIFVCDGYKLYCTLDGSHSFVSITPNISLKNLQQLDFASEQLGWAIIDGGLWKTSDGGHTWIQVKAS
ncbi:hypothetical protein UF75_2202 [Desulfosporosinus sp. I2]|uniref:WD40/YVTN/BNR-like repeat-containing protein n=1 Tax=Desulfosporosinus sp. I2 TaxID=1617025 RepID=UPI0005EE3078|nr:hypothetical protein [Desulfosporosinus sp. I2]KJR47440.1 hypothetical protein UF75_2202 [Desulfosporosinus sp. I2]